MKTKEFILKKSYCFILFLFCIFSATAKDFKIPVEGTFYYKTGDKSEWRYSKQDSSWTQADIPGNLSLEKEESLWIKTSLKIPSQFKDKDVYLELGMINCALEIYADGVFIGNHGTIEPSLVFQATGNTNVCISKNLIHDNSVNISIRCKTDASHILFSQFYFTDKARFVSASIYQNFMAYSIYYMMTAICFFIGCFYFVQFIANRKRKHLHSYSISMISIGFYFFDMATGHHFISFVIQNTFARFCLVMGTGYLAIFIAQFFKLPYKRLQKVFFANLIVLFIAYLTSLNNYPLQVTIFNTSLVCVFTYIIYIAIRLAQVAKAKKRNARTMLIGVCIGSLCGVHDLVYQLIGQVPFAWLQGFGFFLIETVMFIMTSLESSRDKARINDYAKTTYNQKNKLTSMIDDASKVSSETIDIANMLNQAVNSVVKAVTESLNKAAEIGGFITRQNEAVSDTSDALSKLIGSVQNVTDEINNESKIVSASVNETNLLISGVNSVAEGIADAAEFATSLGALTSESSNDVSALVRIMESIKNSSTEILGIVKVVTDFAEKTNMLAMNASIEAAHSGTAGKGFAVIAHEIKNLAAASATQAEKIRDNVTIISDNIAKSFNLSLNVKNALEKVSQGATETSHKINESVQNMEKQKLAGLRITEANEKIVESTEKVNNETAQQYSYSTKVSENMDNLSSISMMTEDAAVEIIGNNQDLAKQITSLQDLAKRTKEAAESLNKMING